MLPTCHQEESIPSIGAGAGPEIHTRGVGLGPLYRVPVCYRHPGGIIGDPASHPPAFPYTISMYRNSVGKNYKKMRQQEYPIQNVIGMQEVMRII